MDRGTRELGCPVEAITIELFSRLATTPSLPSLMVGFFLIATFNIS